MAARGCSHAEARQDAGAVHVPERFELLSERGVRAVTGIDRCRFGKLCQALEAALHLLTVAARKVPTSGAALEDHVPWEQHALTLNVETRRAFGMTGRVQRADL